MSTPQYIVQSQPVQQQQPVQYVTQPTVAAVQAPAGGAAYYSAGRQGGAPVVYVSVMNVNELSNRVQSLFNHHC